MSVARNPPCAMLTKYFHGNKNIIEKRRATWLKSGKWEQSFINQIIIDLHHLMYLELVEKDYVR